MDAIWKIVVLIFLFVGVFMLLMVSYAGISASDNLDQTNTIDTQDVQNPQDIDISGAQKPFFLGLGGLQMILLVVLVLGGIGLFIKMITGRKY